MLYHLCGLPASVAYSSPVRPFRKEEEWDVSKKRSFWEKQTRETKARIFQRLNGQKLNLNLDPRGTLAKKKVFY